MEVEEVEVGVESANGTSERASEREVDDLVCDSIQRCGDHALTHSARREKAVAARGRGRSSKERNYSPHNRNTLE